MSGCHSCSGNGNKVCPVCRGTGRVEEGRVCVFCDGSGLVTCGVCNGTGKEQ